MDDSTWRKTIRQWREDMGLNEAQFGRLVGLSQSMVNQLENGGRPFTQKSLNRILKELKKDYTDLFCPDITKFCESLFNRKRKTDEKEFDPKKHRNFPPGVIRLFDPSKK